MTGRPSAVELVREDAVLTPADLEGTAESVAVRFRPGRGGRSAAAAATAQVTAQVAATDQVTAQVTDQVTDQVTAQVVELCRQPRSAREIMEALGLRHGNSFRQNYLAPLLEAGVVEPTVPDKPRSRLQRYRATEKGRSWLGRWIRAENEP